MTAKKREGVIPVEGAAPEDEDREREEDEEEERKRR
jgi:hypothetical protein